MAPRLPVAFLGKGRGLLAVSGRVTMSNVLLAVWVGVVPGSSLQAASRFVVRSWHIEDGLPEGTVTSVVQAPDGYLWIGTRKGLARFDGVRFLTFEAPKTPGLESDAILQIHNDPQGGLWGGTVDGFLFHFDQQTARTCYRPRHGQVPEEIRRLCRDREGAMWLMFGSGRILRYQDGGVQDQTAEWKLGASRAKTLAADEVGQIWVGTDAELAVWREDQWEAVWSAPPAGAPPYGLGAARGGGVWESRQGYIRRWRGGREESRVSWKWKESSSQVLCEDRQGRLWVGTFGQGLYCYETNGQVTHLLTSDGLGSDLVRDLCLDHEDNLWVATHRGGLSRVRTASVESWGRAEGLSSETVEAVCEDPQGDWWVGTNDGGLNRVSPSGDIMAYGSAQGLTRRQTHVVHCDRQGQIWVGTWGGGLFKKVGDRFQEVKDPRYFGDVIQGIHEDDTGRLWILQRYGPVHLAWLEDGVPGGLDLPGVTDRLAVRTLVRMRDGTVWFGTWNRGLWRVKDGAVKHYGRASGLGSDRILSLHLDSEEVLWIGTEGGGLTCLREGRMATWTRKDGILDDSIEWLATDPNGWLWLATHRGVGRLTRSALLEAMNDPGRNVECLRLGKADGLRSLRCGPHGTFLREGRLALSTDRGLAVIDVRHQEIQAPPPVVIEKVMVDGASVLPLPPLDGAGRGEPLRLGPGGNRFEIQYTALSFTAPEQVRFRHRLQGVDEHWVEAGNQREAVYVRLPPGNYVFQVTASNAQGTWNEAGATLALQVTPFFWQTNWFEWSLGGVLLAGLAMVVVYGERTRLHRKMERLERARALEEERARIAQDLHDDLGTRLTEIGLLGSLASRPGAPLDKARQQAEQITSLAASSVAALDEIVWTLNSANDSLASLVHYVCLYARQFLGAASIRCIFDVAADLPERAFTSEERHHLFLAFKESLNNVVRHAVATEVTIGMQGDASHLKIWVHDNGRGLPKVPAAEDGADGLRNLERRLHRLGGRCDLTSSAGQGTTVTFLVPWR